MTLESIFSLLGLPVHIDTISPLEAPFPSDLVSQYGEVKDVYISPPNDAVPSTFEVPQIPQEVVTQINSGLVDHLSYVKSGKPQVQVRINARPLVLVKLLEYGHFVGCLGHKNFHLKFQEPPEPTTKDIYKTPGGILTALNELSGQYLGWWKAPINPYLLRDYFKEGVGRLYQSTPLDSFANLDITDWVYNRSVFAPDSPHRFLDYAKSFGVDLAKTPILLGYFANCWPCPNEPREKYLARCGRDRQIFDSIEMTNFCMNSFISYLLRPPSEWFKILKDFYGSLPSTTITSAQSWGVGRPISYYSAQLSSSVKDPWS